MEEVRGGGWGGMTEKRGVTELEFTRKHRFLDFK